MANIREYTNPIGGLAPSEIGAEATAQAGFHIGRYADKAGTEIGRSIGEAGTAVAGGYEQYVVQPEISKLSATIGTVTDNLGADWQQTAKGADPNDPNTRSRWIQNKLEPALDQLEENATTEQGRLYARTERNRIEQHFRESTLADQSTMAGVAVKQNLNTFTNGLASNVARDPTSLDLALGTLHNTLPTLYNSSPTLTTAEAAKERAEAEGKLSTELVKTGMHAMVDSNPAAARALIDSGKYGQYLSGGDIDELKNYATVVERRNVDMAKSQQEQVVKQQKEQVQSALVNATTKFAPVSSDGTVTIGPGYFKAVTDVAKMPGASVAEIHSAYRFGQEQLKRNTSGEKAVTDPAIYQQFSQRLRLPEGSPGALTNQEVFDAAASGKLSDHDFSFFNRWVNTDVKNPTITANEKQLQQAFTGVKGFITKSTLMSAHSYGDQRWADFQRDIREEFMNATANGVPARELLDPRSSQYLMTPEVIKRYQITNEQSIQELQTTAAGSLTPLAPLPKPSPSATSAASRGSGVYKPGMTMAQLHALISAGKKPPEPSFDPNNSKELFDPNSSAGKPAPLSNMPTIPGATSPFGTINP